MAIISGDGVIPRNRLFFSFVARSDVSGVVAAAAGGETFGTLISFNDMEPMEGGFSTALVLDDGNFAVCLSSSIFWDERGPALFTRNCFIATDDGRYLLLSLRID